MGWVSLGALLLLAEEEPLSKCVSTDNDSLSLVITLNGNQKKIGLNIVEHWNYFSQVKWVDFLE